MLFAVSGWITLVLQPVLFAVSGWMTLVLQPVLFLVSGWIKLGRKQFTATMAFTAKILENTELLELNPFYPGFDLLILDKASALDNLKFLFSFFTRKKNAVSLMVVCVCVYVCVCVCLCMWGVVCFYCL